jgi:chromosome segregation ATPase
MESVSASSGAGFSDLSSEGSRQSELHRIASQLQAEIDALREFSELERAFLESQVAEKEAKAVQLQNLLESASSAQEIAVSKAQWIQDENAGLSSKVRHLKVELWKAKLTAQQNAGGLAWYRDGLIAASAVGSGAEGSGDGAGLSREALEAATRKVLILQ